MQTSRSSVREKRCKLRRIWGSSSFLWERTCELALTGRLRLSRNVILQVLLCGIFGYESDPKLSGRCSSDLFIKRNSTNLDDGCATRRPLTAVASISVYARRLFSEGFSPGCIFLFRLCSYIARSASLSTVSIEAACSGSIRTMPALTASG